MRHFFGKLYGLFPCHYRHSASGLKNRCAVLRGFVPLGLRDTCPQVMGDLRVARLPGRCPITLSGSRHR